MEYKKIKNRYEINIENKDIYNYFHTLRGGFFKILPIYEGKDLKTKVVIYSSKESYLNFSIYLSNFIIEIKGASKNFYDKVELLKLLNLLEGIKDIGEKHHREVKSVVFYCLNICNKIIKELEE